jgi:hypothetical protein
MSYFRIRTTESLLKNRTEHDLPSVCPRYCTIRYHDGNAGKQVPVMSKAITCNSEIVTSKYSSERIYNSRKKRHHADCRTTSGLVPYCQAGTAHLNVSLTLTSPLRITPLE